MTALALAAVVVTVLALRTSEERQKHGPGGELSALKIGSEAPDFTLYNVPGEPVTLSDFRGRPVLVNFWATWCLPCAIELPELNRVATEYSDRGLVVLGINERERPSKAIAYVEERGFEYEVLLDPLEKAGTLYGIAGLPTTIWIDEDGVMWAVDHGVMTRDRLEARLAQVFGATATPTTP
jgi:cytochrome c biogenesis protein CcmG/thiol:disulfide interchange protein DsbE